jgi:hypothetical protein
MLGYVAALKCSQSEQVHVEVDARKGGSRTGAAVR